MATEELDESPAFKLELMMRQFGGGEAWESTGGQLINIAREVHFRRGKVLYEAGSPSSHIYFLIEGKVSAKMPDGTPWDVEAPGVMGLFDTELGRPYARTATAMSDTHAFVVRAPDFFDMVQLNFTLVQNRIEQLALFAMQTASEIEHRILGADRADLDEWLERVESQRGTSKPNRKLNPFECLFALRMCPLFERSGVQSLHRLANLSHQRVLVAGDKLYEAGDNLTHLYVVVQGNVALVDDERRVLGAFQSPQAVGSYLAVGHRQRTFSAVALTATRVLSISVDDLFDVIEDHHDTAHTITAFLLGWLERLLAAKSPNTHPSPIVPTGAGSLELSRASQLQKS